MSQPAKVVAVDPMPDTGKIFELPKGMLCNDGLLTAEVVRDVWCKLNDRINNVAYMGDPLSKTERELYETMTAWLTLRGKLVVATVSVSS